MARAPEPGVFQAPDLGKVYAELLAVGGHAPAVVVHIAARLLTNQKACSDALLIQADALRVCAADTSAVPVAGQGTMRLIFSVRERAAMLAIAELIERAAPSRVGACS